MLEKHIEQYLVKKTRDRGGICLKLACTGIDGVPDRLVLLPDARAGFVELKAPGKKPRPLQRLRMKQLEQLGYKCFVADSKETVIDVLREIGGDNDEIRSA